MIKVRISPVLFQSPKLRHDTQFAADADIKMDTKMKWWCF